MLGAGAAKLIPFRWFRLAREHGGEAREHLLVQRLEEYFEQRQRQMRERFCPRREQIVYEFELRGYARGEIDLALSRLVHVGSLEEWQGWYMLPARWACRW